MEGSGSLFSSVYLDSDFFARKKQRTTFSPSLLFKIRQGCEEKKTTVTCIHSQNCSLVNTCGIFSNLQMHFQWTCDLWLFIRDGMRLRHRFHSQVIGIGVRFRCIYLIVINIERRIVPYRKRKNKEKWTPASHIWRYWIRVIRINREMRDATSRIPASSRGLRPSREKTTSFKIWICITFDKLPEIRR